MATLPGIKIGAFTNGASLPTGLITALSGDLPTVVPPPVKISTSPICMFFLFSPTLPRTAKSGFAGVWHAHSIADSFCVRCLFSAVPLNN